MLEFASSLDNRLKETEHGCAEFTGSKDTSGYGRVYRCGYSKGAHIVAWELKNGPVPEGLFVLHTCDNPPCCNINHLFLGTKADNTADMFAKGRAYIRRGNDINTSVLTEDNVLEIYGLLDAGYSQREIGEIFDVSHTAIGHISRGRNWNHLYRIHRL